MTEHWQVSHSIDKRPVQKTVVLVNDKALNLNDKVSEKQKTCEKHQLVTRVISDTSTFTVTKAEALVGNHTVQLVMVGILAHGSLTFCHVHMHYTILIMLNY